MLQEKIARSYQAKDFWTILNFKHTFLIFLIFTILQEKEVKTKCLLF